MGGVTCEQYTSVAVGRSLAGHVGEPGDERRAVHAVVGPVGSDECRAEIRQCRLAGVFDIPFLERDPYAPGVLHRADTTALTQAELGLLFHLDLGDDPTRRRIPAGKVDAGRLADHAAAAVAADEVERA